MTPTRNKPETFTVLVGCWEWTASINITETVLRMRDKIWGLTSEKKREHPLTLWSYRAKTGRGERIWTSGPCLPKTVLYQAELHSDRMGNFITLWTSPRKQMQHGRLCLLHTDRINMCANWPAENPITLRLSRCQWWVWIKCHWQSKFPDFQSILVIKCPMTLDLICNLGRGF